MGRPIRVEESKGTPRGRGGVRYGSRSPPPQRMRSHNTGSGRGRSGYKILISKLKEDVSWQSLKDYFKKLGEVLYANVEGGGNA